MPEGVVCLALAGGLQVSAVRMDKVFRDLVAKIMGGYERWILPRRSTS